MEAIDDAIKRDLIECYQKIYGNKWHQFIHKPMVPSPIRFLSVAHGVPIDYIHNIYNQLVSQIKGSPGINVSC
jgi:hypothetical protein